MNPKPLEGRVVMLVGVGSRGSVSSNGRSTAVAFAKAGAQMVLVDADNESLLAREADMKAAGAQCSTALCDVTNEDDVKIAVGQALKQHPNIDVLHFNVASTASGKITRTSTEDFDKMFAINVRSAFWFAKFLLPSMIEARRGVFSFVSSISSVRYLGIPSPTYDMSKAALNALSHHIAAQYGPKGIRSNAILLGMMDTPLARLAIERAGKNISAIYDGYVKKIPLARMGVADDAGEAAVFLASDSASYINGIELPIDGGILTTTA